MFITSSDQFELLTARACSQKYKLTYTAFLFVPVFSRAWNCPWPLSALKMLWLLIPVFLIYQWYTSGLQWHSLVNTASSTPLTTFWSPFSGISAFRNSTHTLQWVCPRLAVMLPRYSQICLRIWCAWTSRGQYKSKGFPWPTISLHLCPLPQLASNEGLGHARLQQLISIQHEFQNAPCTSFPLKQECSWKWESPGSAATFTSENVFL